MTSYLAFPLLRSEYEKDMHEHLADSLCRYGSVESSFSWGMGKFSVALETCLQLEGTMRGRDVTCFVLFGVVEHMMQTETSRERVCATPGIVLVRGVRYLDSLIH
jgi:hypothetical protein